MVNYRLTDYYFVDDTYIYGSDKRGIAYTGKYGVFADNTSCLDWDDPSIKYSFHKWEFFDTKSPGPYCRNPKDDNGAYASKPYCFIPGQPSAMFQMCGNLLSVGKYSKTFNDPEKEAF